MAEEYHQGGICGGNSWWSSASRHALVAASPCSVGGFSDLHMGISSGFGCPNDMDMIKSSSRSSTTCGGFGLNNSSSPSSTLPSDLNQALFLRSGSGRGESNFHNNSMLPMNNNQAFSIVDQTSSSSSGFAITSSSSSPPNNNNNNNSYDGGFPSQLLQSLYDPEVVNVGVVPHHQPQLRSLFNNGCTYSNSPENYGTLSSNDLIISSSPAAASSTSCWPRYSPSSCLRPSLQTRQQQQPAGGGLHFSNINTPFWNAPPAAHDVRSSSTGLFPSLCQPQYTAQSTAAIYNEHKPVTTSSNFTKPNTNEDVHDSSSSTVKKSGGGGGSFCNSTEPVFKRARIETPSPLPTFKVRKEKLGDRITALQQLVSPFGKTDTASVLHEAIEYIKFLHDQVGVLSTPYMKNGASPMQPQQVGCDKSKTEQGGKKDLKSRGLCLVPISSTFPVANETTADFWTPTFGATSFR